MNSRSRTPCSDSEAVAAFAQDLVHHGLYVLPCGGGVIAEPRRAIQGLVPRYGRDAAALLSLAVLTESPEVSFLEGTRWIAAGVMYHLADEWLLMHVREAWERMTRRDVKADESDEALHLIESVIAGASGRLSRPLPKGITELDEMEEYYLFWDEPSEPRSGP